LAAPPLDGGLAPPELAGALPEPAGTVAAGAVPGLTVPGVVTGLTTGVEGAALLTEAAAGRADRAFGRTGALRAGAPGVGVTAKIRIGVVADRVAGASPAWPAGPVTVADPAANAIPKTTVAVSAITSKSRRESAIADGKLAALMPLDAKRSLTVGPAIPASR
jgi:hypothetical protein